MRFNLQQNAAGLRQENPKWVPPQLCR